MYKNNKNNKKIIIFIILILINFIFFYANIKKIIIEIDLSGGLIGEGGPAKFVRGLNETLPYNTRNCRFISSKIILPIKPLMEGINLIFFIFLFHFSVNQFISNGFLLKD